MRKVKFYLDESFTTPEVSKSNFPFEITRIGWGTFDITLEIFFREETGRKESVKVIHGISFD